MPKYILNQQQIQFIRKNYGQMSQRKLASALNIPLHSVKYHTRLLGLSSPRSFIKERIKWTEKEIDIVREYYPIRSNTEVLAMLPGKNEKQLYTKCSALGIKKDKAFWGQYMKHIYHTSPNYDKFKENQFQKGHTTHNKGIPMSAELRKRVEHTWFKRGSTPPNTKYDGAITLRKDKNWGMIQFIRIEKCKWIPLHHHIWLQAGKELKHGHVIAFIDGDVSNTQLENLEQITRAELMRRNSIINYGTELQSKILLLAGFRKKLNQFKHHIHKQHDNATSTN